MNRWLRLVLILAALGIAFMLGYQAKAASRHVPQPAGFDDAAFRPFPTYVVPATLPPSCCIEDWPMDVLPVVRPPSVLVAVSSPDAGPGKPRQRATGQASHRRPSGRVLRGTARWFATGRDGLYAAAGPLLRRWLGSSWRGSVVLVCHERRCVELRLVDWCGCGSGSIIDLSDEVFRYFAPLSRGVIRVVIDKP